MNGELKVKNLPLIRGGGLVLPSCGFSISDYNGGMML
jgi:hypothetical protein